jgi:hypothetical protein
MYGISLRKWFELVFVNVFKSDENLSWRSELNVIDQLGSDSWNSEFCLCHISSVDLIKANV